jgi:hypothetical protein
MPSEGDYVQVPGQLPHRGRQQNDVSVIIFMRTPDPVEDEVLVTLKSAEIKGQVFQPSRDNFMCPVTRLKYSHKSRDLSGFRHGAIDFSALLGTDVTLEVDYRRFGTLQGSSSPRRGD